MIEFNWVLSFGLRSDGQQFGDQTVQLSLRLSLISYRKYFASNKVPENLVFYHAKIIFAILPKGVKPITYKTTLW